MPVIYVKTVKGRVARTSPKGAYIPTDKFVPVEDTAYIRRLLNHYGDIELEPPRKAKAAAQPETAPEPVAVKADPAPEKK